MLEGVLTALDEKTIGIEVDQKPVTVEVSRAAAIALSSDLTEAPRPKGVYGRVILDPTAPACRWPRPVVPIGGRSPEPLCSGRR